MDNKTIVKLLDSNIEEDNLLALVYLKETYKKQKLFVSKLKVHLSDKKWLINFYINRNSGRLRDYWNNKI